MSDNLEKEETIRAAACLPGKTESCVIVKLYAQNPLTPLTTSRGEFDKLLQAPAVCWALEQAPLEHNTTNNNS